MTVKTTNPHFNSREAGFITLDFLFSFVLIMGFTGILFALSLTLTVVEVVQYTSYATARNFSASHINTEEQANIANAKYQALYNHPAVNNLFTGGWFEVASQPVIANFAAEFSNNPEDGAYWGARIPLDAKVLGFSIPFFGSTISDETEEGFKTALSSYLGKEPTQQECQSFATNRFEWIRNLNNSRFSSTNSQPAFVFMDNGC